MITITPKHWVFFACLLVSTALVFLTLRVLITDDERREFAFFILAVAGCKAGWGTWAHLKTQARIDQLLATQRTAERQALVLSTAARTKGHLTSLD